MQHVTERMEADRPFKRPSKKGKRRQVIGQPEGVGEPEGPSVTPSRAYRFPHAFQPGKLEVLSGLLRSNRFRSRVGALVYDGGR